jgi:hypothetical protein
VPSGPISWYSLAVVIAIWSLGGGEALRPLHGRRGVLSSGQPYKIPTAGTGVRVIARRVATRYRLTAIG